MCIMEHNCTAQVDLNIIKDDIKEIRDALLGTEFHPGGALDKIRKLENEVDRLKDYSERLKYMALGFGLAGGGAGATLIKYLFQ